MPYCASCGEQMRTDAIFCARCGARRGDGTTVAGAVPGVALPRTEPPASQYAIMSFALGIAGVALLLRGLQQLPSCVQVGRRFIQRE